MIMGNVVEHATLVSSRSTGATGVTTNLGPFTDINGTPLEDFDELLFMVEVETQGVGVGAIADLHFDIALRDPPVLATATHWERFHYFWQLLPTYVVGTTIVTKVDRQSSSDPATFQRGSALISLTEAESHPVHHGKSIRLQEIRNGSAFSTPAIYTIRVRGVAFNAKAGN